MIVVGNKYIIGGRYFWCVGHQGEDAVLVSGAAQLSVPANTAGYVAVGSINVGEEYVARQSYGSLKAGEKYTVTSYAHGCVTVGEGEPIPLEVFAALFH